MGLGLEGSDSAGDVLELFPEELESELGWELVENELELELSSSEGIELSLSGCEGLVLGLGCEGSKHSGATCWIYSAEERALKYSILPGGWAGGWVGVDACDSLRRFEETMATSCEIANSQSGGEKTRRRC